MHKHKNGILQKPDHNWDNHVHVITLCGNKLHIFGFGLLVRQNKQCHLGFKEIVMSIFLYILTSYGPNNQSKL